MDLTQLEKIGLKEKESKIYLVLLKEGSSLANHLAKKTDILRSSIYDYLDILLERGFVSYTIQSGKKYFQAVDPNKIMETFEEQKEKQKLALNEIIPELVKLQNIPEAKSKLDVFQGKEGMKTAMSYILKDKPVEILTSGSSGVGYKLLPFYLEHWHKERAKNKIKLKIIYNDVPESVERIKNGPSLKCSEIRFAPVNHTSLTGTLIYNNKVLLTIWDLTSPYAILIENDSISQSYKDNFEILWKVSKKY